MKTAVARRAIEAFDTKVTLPEWQLEPDEEAYFGDPGNGAAPMDEPDSMVGPDGLPIDDGAPAGEDIEAPETLDQDWIDEVTGRAQRTPREREPATAPPR